MQINQQQETIPFESLETNENNLTFNTEGLKAEDNPKSKNKRKNSKKKESKNKESKIVKDKSKTRSEEYYIKVQFPDAAPGIAGSSINITVPDKTNFKEAKEEYHRVKAQYKDEAYEVSLIGITHDKNLNILHSKKFERKDALTDVKESLAKIIEIKDEILGQLNKVQEDIIKAKEQKEQIEEMIKNSDYSEVNQTSEIHNDIIRLKYILRKIEDATKIMNSLRPVLNSVELFNPLEDLIKQLSY